MEKPYDNWGFEEHESFVPLALQCKMKFDAEKKKDITYTQKESFISEEGCKTTDLLIPNCKDK